MYPPRTSRGLWLPDGLTVGSVPGHGCAFDALQLLAQKLGTGHLSAVRVAHEVRLPGGAARGGDVVDELVDRLDPRPGEGELDSEQPRRFSRAVRNVETYELQVPSRLHSANQGVYFFGVIERRDGRLHGTINNDADIVRSVKLGDRIPIPEADISDWLYMRDGKMVGNYTLKALFGKMPAAEVKHYKEMMADP